MHDEREMDRILGIDGIQLIGINNRDLGMLLPAQKCKKNMPKHHAVLPLCELSNVEQACPCSLSLESKTA